MTGVTTLPTTELLLLCALSSTAQLPAQDFYSYERKPEEGNGRAAIRNGSSGAAVPAKREYQMRQPVRVIDCKAPSRSCGIKPVTAYSACSQNIKEIRSLRNDSRRKQIEGETTNTPQI
jgi:hypothetical protein